MNKLIHTPDGKLVLDDPFIPGVRVEHIGIEDRPTGIIVETYPNGEENPHPDIWVLVHFDHGTTFANSTLSANRKNLKVIK